MAGVSMKTVTGIFKSAADAHRATHRLQSVLSRDKITLLIPAAPAKAEGSVDMYADERPVMGRSMSRGSGVGIADRVEVAAVTATVPGVGPVIALGMLGGALLGFFGAKADQATNRVAREGLSEHEFFVYEEALRQRRSVLIAVCANEATAASVGEILEDEGAEAVDAVRELWWLGLRNAEQEHYSQGDAKFERDEKFYRQGYEAALHAKYRCKEYDQILGEMQFDLEEVQRRYPGDDLEKPFLKGFERGRAYYQELCNKAPQ
jgi:hypothetical protein